jgi:hypothetical protein
MEDLLNNPFIQSAILPFCVSLIVALLLRPHGWHWAGLSAVAGFAATAYLLTDFQFFPLRSDRKIMLLGSGALVLGVLLDLLPWRRVAPLLLSLAAVGAALWLVWPLFRSREGMALWGLAIGGAVYVAWLSATTESLRDKGLQADAALFGLALGTGLSAVLGATALYGQLVSAIAAAVGARILLFLLGRPVAAGSLMVLPLVVVTALFGLGAVGYAKLPWYSLLPLMLVPLLVRVPVPTALPRLVQQLLLMLLALLPAVVAIFLTWRETGAPPI